MRTPALSFFSLPRLFLVFICFAEAVSLPAVFYPEHAAFLWGILIRILFISWLFEFGSVPEAPWIDTRTRYAGMGCNQVLGRLSARGRNVMKVDWDKVG